MPVKTAARVFLLLDMTLFWDCCRPGKRMCLAVPVEAAAPAPAATHASPPAHTEMPATLDLTPAFGSGGFATAKKRRTHYVKMRELETSIQEAQVVAQHLQQAVRNAELQVGCRVWGEGGVTREGAVGCRCHNDISPAEPCGLGARLHTLLHLLPKFQGDLYAVLCCTKPTLVVAGTLTITCGPYY